MNKKMFAEPTNAQIVERFLVRWMSDAGHPSTWESNQVGNSADICVWKDAVSDAATWQPIDWLIECLMDRLDSRADIERLLGEKVFADLLYRRWLADDVVRRNEHEVVEDEVLGAIVVTTNLRKIFQKTWSNERFTLRLVNDSTYVLEDRTDQLKYAVNSFEHKITIDVQPITGRASKYDHLFAELLP